MSHHASIDAYSVYISCIGGISRNVDCICATIDSIVDRIYVRIINHGATPHSVRRRSDVTAHHDLDTGCSKGTIAGEHHFKPTPDARRVHFGADYIFCHRTESDAFLAAFRKAFAALSDEERSALISKTGAWHHCRAQSWRCDAELADFGTGADDAFRCMAR